LLHKVCLIVSLFDLIETQFLHLGYDSSYAPAPAAPKLVQTYAPAPAAPLVIPRMLDSYAPAPAAPLVIPKVLDSYAPAPAAPVVAQSYGAQIPAPRQLLTSILTKSSGY